MVHTDVVGGRRAACHRMGESKGRWKKRSRTYEGIARAMADQWGGVSGGLSEVQIEMFGKKIGGMKKVSSGY